jgi:hypothetical protein
MAIWYILWSFGIFYGHLVYFVVIWYIFPVLVKKSGNPTVEESVCLVKKTFWFDKRTVLLIPERDGIKTHDHGIDSGCFARHFNEGVLKSLKCLMLSSAEPLE